MKLFSKNLTATDCLKRLSIPNRALTFLPQFHGGHAVNLQVRYGTMIWPLVCTIRREGRYKKPVLSKGWRKFVIRNGLNVGDRLAFHKEEEEEDDESSTSLHYRVELKRASKITPDVDETIGANSSCKDEVKKVPVLKYCMDQNVIVTGLSNGGGSGDGQVSDCGKEKTAVADVVVLEQNFNLGLTVGGKGVHQASCSTSFFKTDQRVGFDLNTVLGHDENILNLDLTLGHQYN